MLKANCERCGAEAEIFAVGDVPRQWSIKMVGDFDVKCAHLAELQHPLSSDHFGCDDLNAAVVAALERDGQSNAPTSQGGIHAD